MSIFEKKLRILGVYAISEYEDIAELLLLLLLLIIIIIMLY